MRTLAAQAHVAPYKDAEVTLRSVLRAERDDNECIDDTISAIRNDPHRYHERQNAHGAYARALLAAGADGPSVQAQRLRSRVESEVRARALIEQVGELPDHPPDPTESSSCSLASASTSSRTSFDGQRLGQQLSRSDCGEEDSLRDSLRGRLSMSESSMTCASSRRVSFCGQQFSCGDLGEDLPPVAEAGREAHGEEWGPAHGEEWEEGEEEMEGEEVEDLRLRPSQTFSDLLRRSAAMQ